MSLSEAAYWFIGILGGMTIAIITRVTIEQWIDKRNQQKEKQ